MATGTTADFVLTRNDIITHAFRKLEIAANSTLMTRGAEVLNLIIRQEDAKGTQQSKQLWSLAEGAVILTAAGTIYGTSQGLASNLIELSSVLYRNTSGDDTAVEIIDSPRYEAIADKNSAGDVEMVYLVRDDVTRSNQRLYIYPAPSSVGTTSQVTGTDSLNYSCIMGHTSDTTNKPITGQNWRMYWHQVGSSGSAWATATAYTNGELLRYIYKRPLYDFDASTDNPDMPAAWTRYLIWRLANDLSPEFDLDMESRVWIKNEYREAAEELFGSTMAVTTDTHNKAMYF